MKMEFVATVSLVIFITIYQTVGTSEVGSNDLKPSTVIKDLLTNYDKNDLPRSDEPTNVSLGMYVMDFHFTNQLSMEFSATFYMRQRWNDPRLSFQDEYPTLELLYFRENDIDSVWKPDIFIGNEKSSTRHELFTEHRLMKVRPNGDVWYSVHVSVIAFCSMFLRKFPFDVQNCSLWLEAYTNTASTMQLFELPNALQTYNMSIPSFVLTGKSVEKHTYIYFTGTYQNLQMTLTLTRDTGFYLLNIYFPSILIVILSWLSFWLNSNASVSRMFLGLMSILFMAIITLGVDTQQASVSYATALDVWTNVCFLFTFAVLFQFAAVYFLANRLTSDSKHRLVNEEIDMGERRIRSSASEDQQPVLSMETQTRTWSEKLDFYSRIAFPAVFLFFNIVYWSVYAS